MSVSRACNLATTVAFVLALAVPTVDLFLRPAEARSVLRENRIPAPPPTPITDLATLARFPTSCERWFADRLGARDILLRQWQRSVWLGLGVDPKPTIMRGLDGFDFYTFGRTTETDRGAIPFTEAELGTVTRSLEAQRKRCKRLGAEFVFVVVPNKETIYTDLWPAREVRVGPTRFEQLLAWLSQHSDVHLVDLRAALVRERGFDRRDVDDCAYYPLGSHFSWRGGLAAWNEIARELNPKFPSVRPLARDDYTLVESLDSDGDSLWDNTYVSDLVQQRTWWLSPRPGAEATFEPGEAANSTVSRRDDAELPTGILVHDSYGPWMLPFAARSFSHLLALRGNRVPRDQIERHRPRVVIHETTERTLEWDLGDLAQDVEHVTETMFRSFAPYFGPVDCARDPVLATSGGVTMKRSPEGFLIEQRSGDGLVEFPSAELDDGTDLAVHMKITSPFEGIMLLYFLTKHEPNYGRARVLALDLHRGDNDLYLRLLVPELTGAVRMRLNGPADYLLRAFEMRVAH